MNEYKDILEMIEYPKKGVLSKDIFKEGKISCSLFCMASGTEISEHTSIKQGLVYVLEGEGNFNLQGKDIKMNEGVFINMEENVVHSLKVRENTSFILVLI
ncbi:cupin domain-containing protein [Candidatus Woesearchaeota archaeon]|nr:cupin domain-containing protein [Candidatus Woesearchaeota archaeon]